MLDVSQPRKRLSQLLRQLAGDGARVAEAELALAYSELSAVIRGFIVGVALGAAAICVMLVAVMILAQSAAIGLTPYMATEAYAYLTVGLVLVAITCGLVFAAYRFFKKKHKPLGLIFKWFADVANSSSRQS
jgi:hypothetical protein